MNWGNDRSIALSRVCVAVFALGLLLVDAGGWWLAGWMAANRLRAAAFSWLFLLTLYAGSLFGWVCLWCLWRLLRAVGAGAVFTEENTRLLRRISWCCTWAAGISLLSGFYYLPFLFLAAAEGFMALIVRIVKNAFRQALEMKAELDYTV